MLTVIVAVLVYIYEVNNKVWVTVNIWWYIMDSNIDRRERSRNRRRRKEDISVHVGWELVGREGCITLYLTCGEG